MLSTQRASWNQKSDKDQRKLGERDRHHDFQVKHSEYQDKW
ncbi:hypothetical protein PSYMO_33702, partial [Pseudomonas amygdali pv. mori str. 301020]